MYNVQWKLEQLFCFIDASQLNTRLIEHLPSLQLCAKLPDQKRLDRLLAFWSSIRLPEPHRRQTAHSSCRHTWSPLSELQWPHQWLGCQQFQTCTQHPKIKIYTKHDYDSWMWMRMLVLVCPNLFFQGFGQDCIAVHFCRFRLAWGNGWSFQVSSLEQKKEINENLIFLNQFKIISLFNIAHLST